MAGINRQIQLVELPKGKLSPTHFTLAEAPIPSVSEGEVLLKTILISLDAANRAWMQGATYRDALESGQVMAGGGLAEVIESKAEGFAVGDLVFADTGWQEYIALPAKNLNSVPRLEPLSYLISVYGIAGLTAYFGLLEVGQPKAGETIVVSAAAGSVGSIVGQIAKLKGCRVVGIAGGAEKCKWLVDELGFDAAVDYKNEPVHKALKAACPEGIDVYFDNVGGEMLDAAILNMNEKGRLIISGAVSEYNKAEPRGIRNTLNFITHRLRMEGLVVYDYFKRFPEAQAEMAGWISTGRLKFTEDISEGIEGAPAAFIGLFEGENHGRRLIKVS